MFETLLLLGKFFESSTEVSLFLFESSSGDNGKLLIRIGSDERFSEAVNESSEVVDFYNLINKKQLRIDLYWKTMFVREKL